LVKRAVFLCVLAFALPSAAGEPLAMRLSPSVAFEPAALTVRTVIEADAANRALEIVAASADFYRSSRIELEGASARRLNVFEFRNLPSGSYEVTSVLVGADGQRTTVSRRFRVSASAGSSR
jgi:hypothetical protein